MAFIYDEPEYAVRSGGFFNPEAVNVTAHYLKHFSNLMILELFYSEPRNIVEKLQLEKEMKIANKKMEFWRKFRHFDVKEAEQGIKEIKRQWNKQ